jgi:hypothetical protein
MPRGYTVAYMVNKEWGCHYFIYAPVLIADMLD